MQGRKSFDRIVVFGTSLSDPGNAHALLGKAGRLRLYARFLSFSLDRLYASGWEHFSNGSTWVEQYALSVGLARSTRPAFGAAPEATNYAVGGTRARNAGSFTLRKQVSAFLRQFAGAAPANALYVIEMGSNDIRDALADVQPAYLADAVESIAANITALGRAGARKFLVLNAPNIGLTPAVRALEARLPGAAEAAALLARLFNAYLDRVLTGLARTLPAIEIARLDVCGALQRVIDGPAAFGLTNVTEPCLSPSAPGQAQALDGYLFWDEIHPTQAGHAILAGEATRALS